MGVVLSRGGHTTALASSARTRRTAAAQARKGTGCKQGQKVTNTQVPYFHSPVSSKGCPTDTSQAPFLMLVINRLPSVTTVEPVQALHSQDNRWGAGTDQMGLRTFTSQVFDVKDWSKVLEPIK